MRVRIKALDGLRGVAALMVVTAHYFGETPNGSAVFMWGWIGVDIFFVLSGYLIGSIILDHHDEAGFFAKFYLRRAARIVPVYAITVATVLGLCAVLADRSWVDHPLGWLYYLTFTQNFAIPFEHAGGRWLLTTWTLAVEEQFYLIIPLIILLAPKRWLLPLLPALWIGALGFRYAVYHSNVLFALTLLPSRADLLISGVLAALADRRWNLRQHLLTLRVAPLTAMVALLACSLIDKNTLTMLISPSLIGIATACFILSVVHGAPEGARFESPVLRFFGRVSYALYLFHQPVAGLLHGLLLDASPDVGTFAAVMVSFLSVAVSLALAWLSWMLLEMPILHWARDVARLRRLRWRFTLSRLVVNSPSRACGPLAARNPTISLPTAQPLRFQESGSRSPMP